MKLSQTVAELIYANQGTHENVEMILYYDHAVKAVGEAFEIAAKICDDAGSNGLAEKIRSKARG